MAEEQTLLDSFFAIAGCGIMLLDGSGRRICSSGGCALHCPLGEKCIAAHLNAYAQSQRFGGRYLYLCPGGFIFSASEAGSDRFLAAGPVSAGNGEDDFPDSLSGAEAEAMRVFAASLPCFAPPKITALSELLCALSDHFSTGLSDRRRQQSMLRQQQEINEYVQSLKAHITLGPDGYVPYPYDKEKQLLYAIRTGNAAAARQYLNEILGHIFCISSENLDAIKIRAIELTTLISRAAMDAGADMNFVYVENPSFISDFMHLRTMEEVCFALAELLRRFTEETFVLKEVKHLDLITRAVSCIRNNYMHKITLEDVARQVYLSPSYLSRIFKEEMKTSFSSYLNQVRIEKSKVLLMSGELSIAEISDLVGFFDQSYFNKVFKRLTGINPRRYREQMAPDTNLSADSSG